MLEVEYSPGRRADEFLEDGTAFDIYVEYVLESGGKGFLGVEVKYHENLVSAEQLEKNSRYHMIAELTGWFDHDLENELGASPLMQIWRDHLLAASMLQAPRLQFTEGFHAIIYPEGNKACRDAMVKYQNLLENRYFFQMDTRKSSYSI